MIIFLIVTEKKQEELEACFLIIAKKNKKMTSEDWYNFICDSGNNFIPSYIPLMEKRKVLNEYFLPFQKKLFFRAGK